MNMNRRAILQGVAIAFAIGIASQLMLRGQQLSIEFVTLNTPTFLQPLFSELVDVTSALPWVATGFCVGYLCKQKPFQHAAVVGALYGLILGSAVSLAQAANVYDLDSKLMLGVFTLIHAAKNSLLFALVAPAGHAYAAHRASL
ncbi:hypothetical protein [Aquipseudomonas alcaligenes]|uniref:hypothetical protein n=1 Tax=Aquipseudomonas alcaligenes TaxID=43263 RepID=UPI00374A5608